MRTATHPMLAITFDRYGPPASLSLAKVERPTIADDQVLVRVAASSVNPGDWHRLTGTPWLVRLESGLRRPRRRTLGTDLAGRVEAVGDAVTGLAPGDEVFGWAAGAFAEYVAAPASNLTAVPAGVTLEQAGTVGVAAFTALQAVRDRGRVGPGTRLLLIGASGGVGTFALQIAVAFGAEVTAVCSTPNVAQAAELGADRVIDYRTQDVEAEPDDRYDAIIDVPGTLLFATIRRLLVRDGRYVIIGGPKRNRLLGPLPRLAAGMVRFAFTRQHFAAFIASENAADLATLAQLMADGAVTPVVERHYALADVPEALRHLEDGHARAKIGIRV